MTCTTLYEIPQSHRQPKYMGKAILFCAVCNLALAHFITNSWKKHVSLWFVQLLAAIKNVTMKAIIIIL